MNAFIVEKQRFLVTFMSFSIERGDLKRGSTAYIV